MMNRRDPAREAKRRAEMERETQSDLRRVLKRVSLPAEAKRGRER
jgi:hypothetical protein